jgi:ATP-dependent helicase/nuclease subunit A
LSKLSEISPHIRTQQHRASNPDISVWVSANAGSGKTHVLTQRVMRHLLAGVPPAKILCLTFTKAAAANMAGRVFAALAKWTELDDDALAAAIIDMGAPHPTKQKLVFARRLFAQAVETPGGLKIQTIHAFCERLLHLFPFEANVPSRFEVVDDKAQAELLKRARTEVLAEAQNDPNELGEAYALLSEEASQAEFEDLIRNAQRYRDIFRDRDPKGFEGDLRKALALGTAESFSSITCDMLEGGLAPGRWRDFAAFFASSGKKTDAEKAGSFLEAAEVYEREARLAENVSDAARDECLKIYCRIFFTEGGTGSPVKRLATAELEKSRPDLVEEIREEQVRLEGLRDRRKAAEAFERSHALMLIMQKLFSRYHQLKGFRGLLDFEDLIQRTSNLLQRSDARWVLYKLDAGIDHILVDEAQDTSQEQWKILEELTGEFSAGVDRTSRTFFAVGDEKQSIFSFQGAAPHMFHAMRRSFERAFSRGGSGFAHVELKDSFRSVPSVLSMVDQVFAEEQHQKGLVTADQWMGHNAALKQAIPGLVEIWPPVSTGKAEDPRDWELPLDVKGQSDPANILARRVASKVAALVARTSGERVFDAKTGRFRPVRPGDILILVRTRNAFFDAMIRALKQNQVPVAGADRLELMEHIAILDLMAVGRIARLPEDDLGLACVLKSPLIGFDDEDLLRLAPLRRDSLFTALLSSEDERDQMASAKIRLWQSRSALPPFTFYARLLGEDGGRRAMEARLGPEACDALDEFLRLALEAERKGFQSLATFLSSFENVDLQVKRDMETLDDCVRVMTVHAAKGLEAKIVFLPDTCSAPTGQLLPKLFAMRGTGARGVLVWSPRKDGDPQIVAAARAALHEAAEDEYRRLLYVALTRAEERLYLCGFHGAKGPPEQSWSKMISRSVGEDFEQIAAFWNPEEKILRHASALVPQADTSEAETALPQAFAHLPDFLRRAAPTESHPAPPLRPSNALAAAEAEFDPMRPAMPRAALERGRLMHILLQYLPQVSVEGRREAALRFLQVRGEMLDEASRSRLVDEALAVFRQPRIGDLFGPRSRAEVAVAGQLRRSDGKVIDIVGQVDRIVETQDQVLIADFKTGRTYADEEIPPPFVTQMALYKAVLAPLWPKKSLVMLLIFTAEAKIMELSETKLAKAIAELGLA